MDPPSDTDENIIAYLEHVVDWLYESLGPANDDILAMARDEWISRGHVMPTKYAEDAE